MGFSTNVALTKQAFATNTQYDTCVVYNEPRNVVISDGFSVVQAKFWWSGGWLICVVRKLTIFFRDRWSNDKMALEHQHILCFIRLMDETKSHYYRTHTNMCFCLWLIYIPKMKIYLSINLVYPKVNKKNVWVSMLPSLFVIFISLKYENSKNLKIKIDFIA